MNSCFALVLAAALLTGCSGKAPSEAPAPEPVYFRVDSSTAGALTGSIEFRGKRPARKPIDMDQDPECERLHGKKSVSDESVVVNPNRTLSNVFVYVKKGLEDKKFAASTEPVNIDQKGCWFHPRVTGIQAGQPFTVSNSDPVTHNIHPLAQLNREWNQSQAQGDPPLKRRFARAEIMIPVKCNIHRWMRSYVGVLDHPYFAVTGADGSFAIRNLPPGSYTVAAWHETLGAQEQAVVLDASGAVSTNFTFTGE